MRFLILGVLGLLVVSFFGVPAHASSAVLNTTANAFTNSAGDAIVLTVATPGDLIVVNAQIYDLEGGNTHVAVTAVSDSLGNVFSQIVTHENSNGAACNTGGGTCHDDEIWAVGSRSAGADTITLTFSDSLTNGNVEVMDVVGASSTVSGTSVGSCSFASGCPLAMSTQVGGSFVPLPFNPGADFAVASLLTACQAASTVTPGTGFTLVSPLSVFAGLAMYSGPSSVSPTTFPASCGTSNQWIDVGAVFIFGSVSTTTLNTMCLGACSGGPNSTAKYVTNGQLVFYQSQNLQTPGLIDNVTLKVGAVHVTVAVGTVYVLLYEPVSPLVAPAGGNAYVLQQSYVVSLTNGTSAFFIHTNPQFQVCASCFYAVGFMAGTNASRGSGATGSGVSLYQTSQVGITEYTYAVGSKTPPTTFFSNTVKTPRDFMYVHETFPVAIVTSTVTSTVGGVVTSTVLTTITSTTLDASLAINGTTDDAILLLVILLPAMVLMVPIAVYTKSASAAGLGFVAGLMIGSGIGVQAGLVPPVFLGITVLVSIFMIVGMVRMQGGGGGA